MLPLAAAPARVAALCICLSSHGMPSASQVPHPSPPQVTTRSMLDEPTNPAAKHGATVVLVSGGVESAALLSCECEAFVLDSEAEPVSMC